MPPDEKRVLSIPQFTNVYGPGRSKTYEEIGAGRLKAVKVGARTFIPVDNAEEWLKNLKEFGHSTEASPRKPLHEGTRSKEPRKPRHRSARPRKRTVSEGSRDLESEE